MHESAPSVLILTAGYGEGHHAAARGLKEGFDALERVRAEVLDPCKPALGNLYERSRRQYLRMVQSTPWLWALLYGLIDRFPAAFGNAHRLLRPLKDELVAAFKQVQPRAVVSVYPIYGYLIRAAATEAGIPELKSVVLVTDSISVNALWYRCDADAFLVPNEETAEILRAGGVAAEKVQPTGFPVSPRFATQVSERPSPGHGVKPRILFVASGAPKRTLALVERLLRELDAALTVTVAKDATLGRELEALASRMGKTVEVLGWVDNLPALLQRSHVVIGKAGGALVQETLAAGTPMLITHILPGQEAGNARLLLQHGCGALAPTTEAALQVLTQWFRNGAEAWHRLHRNASALGRPDAARCSARWVLEHLAPASAAAPAFGVRADRNTLH